MLRPSVTVHAYVPSPIRSCRVLVIYNRADDNSAAMIFQGNDKGKPAGFGFPGGGVEGLVKIPGIKQTEMRFQKIEELGYRILRVEGNDVYGNYQERETRFQKIMRLYPLGSILAFEIQKNGVTEIRKGTLVREERYAEVATRETYAETEYEIAPVLTSDGSPILTHRWESPEHCKYTFLGQIVSPFDHEIQERDESAGIGWLNPLDSLPRQLARLMEIRPEYTALMYKSHLDKFMNYLRNGEKRIEISARVKEEMSQDHPKRDMPYGKSFLLVGRTPEESLVHPSWYHAFRLKKNRYQDDYTPAMRYVRDKGWSGLTREEFDEGLRALGRIVKKNELETMEAQASKTIVAVPETVVGEVVSQSETSAGAPVEIGSEEQAAKEAITMAETKIEEAEEVAVEAALDNPVEVGSAPASNSSEEDAEYWAKFARPEVLQEWELGKK
ncbi:MAG: hypothetical protein Q7R73_03100 [bacterium]|nr:hypothetical protein [bacterium]